MTSLAKLDHELVRELFDQIDHLASILDVFNHSSDIVVYIKNLKSQFVYGNQTFLDLLGVQNQTNVIGKTDRDFFEPYIAELYIAEDTEVFAGQEIINKKWQIPNKEGEMIWYLSSKKPLRNSHKNIIGHIGLIRNLAAGEEMVRPYKDLSAATDYIHSHINEKIEISHLAKLCGLSVSQFDRKFKRYAGITPSKYILKVRLNMVASRLVHSESSLSDISYQVGFCDQAYMSNQFKQLYGLSPSKYRSQHSSRY